MFVLGLRLIVVMLVREFAVATVLSLVVASLFSVMKCNYLVFVC